MAKITTRENEVDRRSLEIAEKLTGVIERVAGQSLQALLIPGEVSENIDFLIDAMEEVINTSLHTAHDLKRALVESEMDNVTLTLMASQQQARIDRLSNAVYDEALEYAAIDLIEMIVTSGMAAVSDEGDLVFDERSVFTKNDLKPALRGAINSWIDQKI